jgi:hypothetical protein
MAMNSGPTDKQGIGGELAGGDRGTRGLDRAEEARVGDVGSPRPVSHPDTGAQSEATTGGGTASGGAPAGEAPDIRDINPGDGPGQTPGE